MPSADRAGERSVRIETLSETHGRTAFSCGNRRIDQYLADGLDYQVHNLGRVFVAVDRKSGSRDVLGYYAIHNHSIHARLVPNPLGARLNRETEVGTLYVMMLGVDRGRQRQGIGTDLLIDVLRRTRRVNKDTAVWAVVLDALDARAEKFYRSLGFETLDSATRRMFFPTIDIPAGGS